MDLDDGVVDIDQRVLIDPAISGAVAASPVRNWAATASIWRTWPKVNVSRNVPNVEGARIPVHNRPIPPWRNRSMSSMESAPATIPATTEATFNPAFAPLSARDTQMLISQPGKAGAWCQSQHRDQPDRRHEIRVVDTADLRGRV